MALGSQPKARHARVRQPVLLVQGVEELQRLVEAQAAREHADDQVERVGVDLRGGVCVEGVSLVPYGWGRVTAVSSRTVHADRERRVSQLVWLGWWGIGVPCWRGSSFERLLGDSSFVFLRVCV